MTLRPATAARTLCSAARNRRATIRAVTTAVIVDAIRTPLGKRNGKLKDWHPVDLAAETLKALVDRTGIDPGIVDDVVMGCVMQVGEQGVNIARNAVLAAGWPEHVPGTTVDRQCGSSQQAAHFAAQGVIAGAYDVVVAAGVEVMTRVPMGAVDGRRQVRLPVRPEGRRPLRRPGRARAAGHLGRADRRQVGHLPRGHGRVRRPQPAAAPPQATAEGRFEREILPVLGADGAIDEGRRGPARDDDGVAGQAQAVVPPRGGGRPGHRRQLVADHRRRVGGADHERGEGAPRSGSRRGPGSSTSPSPAPTPA